MEYKRFNDTYLVRLNIGDEICASLKEFAEKEGIKLASVQGIGATNDATVGVFSPKTQKYTANEFKEDYEITSLIGTIDTMDGQFYSHLHINLGGEGGRAFGGHLNRAVISVTSEIVVRLIDGQIDRKKDPSIGINLWKF